MVSGAHSARGLRLMKTVAAVLFMVLLSASPAQGGENWVFFHSEKEYFFEAPEKGIPLKPAYQRETYYYDRNSMKRTGVFIWKTVRARVKVESWGVYSNIEKISVWEADCGKKVVRRFDHDAAGPARAFGSGDGPADAFYTALCR
jgi:hypothetical protein